MSETVDWRVAASAEYRTKRADLIRKVAVAAKAERRATERRESLEKDLADLDAGARAFGLEIASVPEGSHQTGDARPIAEGSVREIIVTALEGAYPNGLRAKQLKAIIEERLGREIHYKTPGMTLYRLAEAGDVRREGYMWFLTHEPFHTPPRHDAPEPPDFGDEDDDGPNTIEGNDIDWLEEQYREALMRDG